MTSVWGAVVGGLFLQFWPDIASMVSRDLVLTVFGALLVVSMRFMPRRRRRDAGGVGGPASGPDYTGGALIGLRVRGGSHRPAAAWRALWAVQTIWRPLRDSRACVCSARESAPDRTSALRSKNSVRVPATSRPPAPGGGYSYPSSSSRSTDSCLSSRIHALLQTTLDRGAHNPANAAGTHTATAGEQMKIGKSLKPGESGDRRSDRDPSHPGSRRRTDPASADELRAVGPSCLP